MFYVITEAPGGVLASTFDDLEAARKFARSIGGRVAVDVTDPVPCGYCHEDRNDLHGSWHCPHCGGC